MQTVRQRGAGQEFDPPAPVALGRVAPRCVSPPGLLPCRASWWWPGAGGSMRFGRGRGWSAEGLEWKGEPGEGEARLVHTRVHLRAVEGAATALVLSHGDVPEGPRRLLPGISGMCVLGPGSAHSWWPLETSGQSSLPMVHMCCRRSPRRP